MEPMTYRFEGGPLDGQRRETGGAHIIRVPRRVPWNAPTDLSFSVWEYERVGSVYRFEDLIHDAKADMSITAEAFQEPQVRRYARRQLRRVLQEFAPNKQLGSIVWAIGHSPRTATFVLAAFVGGRRCEFAEHYRREHREP